MADETIVIDFVAQVSNAIENVKKYDEKIAETRKKLADLHKASAGSLQAVANEIKRQVAELRSAISELQKPIKPVKPLKAEFLGTPDEIKKQYTAAIQQYQADLAKYNVQIEQYRQNMAALRGELKMVTEAAAIYNAQLKEQGGAVKLNMKTQQAAAKELIRQQKELAAQQKKTQQSTQQSTSIFSKLGDVGKFVFGTVLGITAIGVFNQLRSAFTTLIEDGQKFLQTMYRFETSVQNLQRRGLDITLKEAKEQVASLRKEFGVFSQQEAMDAVANVQLLTANFGFTTEQMYKMTEAAAALSVITGEDLDEASRKLALFLSSGYSEGLQRAGLAINKLSVSQKAFEMGLINTKFAYSQLTEIQRAQIAELVIEEQTVTLLTSAREAQETQYGKLLKAQADLETETGKLALATIPLKQGWLDFEVRLVKTFQTYRQILALGLLTTAKVFVAPVMVLLDILSAYWDLIINHQATQLDSLGELYRQNVEEYTKILMKNLGLEYDPYAGMGEAAGEEKELGRKRREAAAAKASADAQIDAYEARLDAAEDFYETMKEYEEKGIEIEKEYIDEIGYVTEDGLSTILGEFSDFYGNKEDMSYEDFKDFIAQQESLYGEIGEITEDGLMKAWEIWRKYTEKIAEINEKLAQDIADENKDYQNDIAELDLDTQRKLEDAARKYRYDELRAEREFQERMRRLREEFLFDLEDALRERDALAVLRLIRRYRLDVEQAKRKYEDERQERLEAYKQEIEDIKRQAEYKRQELEIEHKRKLADLEREAQEERDQAEIDRKLAHDELIADLIKEREDAKIERDKSLSELEQWLADQLKAILSKYREMVGVTDEMVQEMADLFEDYLGKNGFLDGTVTDFEEILEDAVEYAKKRVKELQELEQQVSDLIDKINRDPERENTPSEESGDPLPHGGGRSAGGYASYGKYTLGERGREFVLTAQTTRMLEQALGTLNQGRIYSALAGRAVRSAPVGENTHASPGSQNSFVADIRLADGLIGEIVDQTMDETSKVYLTATRERR